METRHLRISYEEALSSKKQLLSSEINLLHILKKLKSYKLLRLIELTLKNKMNIQIKDLKNKLKTLDQSLPEENTPTIEKHNTEIKIKESKDIHEELKDIQMKLEKLR